MLHVTNGDSVIETLRATDIPGDRIAWDDPLHEGPVPAGLEPGELGACGWPETFRAGQDREQWVFMGDTAFLLWVHRLEQGGALADFRLTGLGEALLAGQADWVETAGVDRWLGGVHLVGRGVRWRWDRAAGRLKPAPVLRASRRGS